LTIATRIRLPERCFLIMICVISAEIAHCDVPPETKVPQGLATLQSLRVPILTAAIGSRLRIPRKANWRYAKYAVMSLRHILTSDGLQGDWIPLPIPAQLSILLI
jgi:hypothetical protein